MTNPGKEIAAFGKRYGASGVLALWLGFTTMRVSNLEEKLYKCMEGKTISHQVPEIKQTLAILPKEIKIVTKKSKS